MFQRTQDTYQDTLAIAARVAWRVEDIIGGDKRLDFGRPFMPASLSRVAGLAFLSPDEQRTLNQIQGHAYLSIFGIVEEFILPFVIDHARPTLSGDGLRTRALLGFAAEEAKHIHLFREFRTAFEEGFGQTCNVIGPAEAIGQAVLAHRPLGVALAILQIEWMTQRHYLDSIKDDTMIDPLFKSLLKHHWIEEAQHARLDGKIVEAMAEGQSAEEIAAAVEDYLKIGLLFDAGIAQQADLNLAALAAVTGRSLGAQEMETAKAHLVQADRWTYLGSGMTHPKFLAALGAITPEGRRTVEQVAPAFC